MPAFAYQALDSSGKSKSGILDGDSARQVRQRLRDQGLAPTKVELTTQQSARKGFSLSQWFQPSLSVTERALVTRQLATLIGAGLPVEEALLAVSKQTASQAAEGMLVTVRSASWRATRSPGHLRLTPKPFQISIGRRSPRVSRLGISMRFFFNWQTSASRSTNLDPEFSKQ